MRDGSLITLFSVLAVTFLAVILARVRECFEYASGISIAKSRRDVAASAIGLAFSLYELAHFMVLGSITTVATTQYKACQDLRWADMDKALQLGTVWKDYVTDARREQDCIERGKALGQIGAEEILQ